MRHTPGAAQEESGTTAAISIARLRFPGPVDYPIAWGLFAFFWVVIGGIRFAAIRGGSPSLSTAEALLLAEFDAITWGGVCLAAYVLAWAWVGTVRWQWLIARTIAASVLFAVGRAAFVEFLAGEALQVRPESLPVHILGVATFFTEGAAVRFFFAYQEREAYSAGLQVQLSNAHLRMLRMQLHPHFLFNTLNSISALLHLDAHAATQMLDRTIALFRLAVDRTDQVTVRLEEELYFLRLYLSIEGTRFGDRLRVVFDVQDEAKEFPVPYLILQPAVENAIRHGVAPLSTQGSLTVRARCESDRLTLEVLDNGVGLKPHVRPGRNGLGIANTRARLQQLYGSDCSLSVENQGAAGVRFRVELPRIIGYPGDLALPAMFGVRRRTA